MDKRFVFAEEESKQVGVWIRVSTEDQVKGESPEHHEQRARFYAQAKGWEVVDVYHLEAVSGKSVMHHPETQRMLKDVASGRITGLIFSKLARLARNTKELLDFADIFRQHNADLISLGESIDTSTPAGRLFYTIIAAMAQWEREEISARVAASVPIRAKLGKPIGGLAPFGYQWKDRKLIPDPNEAPIRKLVFEMFLQHRRKKMVARLLNDAGYRTRSGAEFSDTTVHRLIADPLAKGLRRANYTKTTEAGKSWKFKPKEEWVFSEVEPIVSEELWEECNRLLNAMHNGHRPARQAVQLFGSLAHCQCGTKMYKLSNTEKYVCRKCRNKIPVDDLEAVFHEQLKGFVFSTEEVAEYLGRADEAVQEKQELLASLARERERVEKEMDKLMELYLAGEVPKEGFGKKYRPFEERLTQIDDQLPALQGEIDFLKIQQLSSDEIISEARDFYTRWPDLNHTEKRQIIEAITESVVIGTDEVAINLRHLPTSPEIVAKWQHGAARAQHCND